MLPVRLMRVAVLYARWPVAGLSSAGLQRAVCGRCTGLVLAACEPAARHALCASGLTHGPLHGDMGSFEPNVEA